MAVIGYWVGNAAVLCPNCYHKNWDEVVPILDAGDPVDTPSHCRLCEALLPRQLTLSGRADVAAAIRDAAEQPERLRRHRRCIVRQWAQTYGALTDLAPQLLAQTAGWPTRDAYSPHPAGDAPMNPADEQHQPDPDDAYLSPSGPLGAKTSASLAGVFLGAFDTTQQAEQAIRAEMDRTRFWPNAWLVDDHGGLTPWSLDPVDQPPTASEDTTT